ncbi:MAG: nuclear transport factor 2 family protein [Nocardioidaceae bacterium]
MRTQSSEPMTPVDFESLMSTLASAWNDGDIATAMECFTADIVYLEPPDRQHHVGLDALYEFSGGSNPPPMSLVWHHLIFDPPTGIGMGEYTYRGRRQYHGVAIVQCAGGRIRRWREYEYADELDWPSFVGDSAFD